MLTAGLLLVAVMLVLGGLVWAALLVSACAEKKEGPAFFCLAVVATYMASLVFVGSLIARLNQTGG